MVVYVIFKLLVNIELDTAIYAGTHVGCLPLSLSLSPSPLHLPPLIQGFHVYKVIDGLPAQKCGKIAIGDKLLQVSKTCMINISQKLSTLIIRLQSNSLAGYMY